MPNHDEVTRMTFSSPLLNSKVRKSEAMVRREYANEPVTCASIKNQIYFVYLSESLLVCLSIMVISK